MFEGAAYVAETNVGSTTILGKALQGYVFNSGPRLEAQVF